MNASDRPAGPSGAVLAAVFGAFGGVYALLSRFCLQAFPFSGDEYSYLLQAELFARGVLRAPAPAGADLLGVDHVVIDDWVRSKYPPGTSALLSLGVRAGAPWLVTPVEGVVALLLVWLAARALFGARPAFVTLLALGVSPLFAVEAITFFSHTATTMWLAASFAAVAAWSLSRKTAWLLAAGAALGCAFLTRPFDAALFALALCALRSWRVLLLTGAGASPFVGAHFAYQWAVFGSPWRDGYAAYEPTFRAVYGAETAEPPLSLLRLVNPLEWWFHLEIGAAFLSPWTLPGLAVLALIGALAIPRGERGRPMRDFAVAIVAVALVALLVTVSSAGDDGPRPRYLSTTLLAVAVLAGPGWAPAAGALRSLMGDRWTRVVAIVTVAASIVLVGTVAVERGLAIRERGGLYEAVEREHVTDGVVVVRARYPTRYARNGAFFDRPVLYLSAPAKMSMADVAARYPGRPLYEATEGSPWTLVRAQ